MEITDNTGPGKSSLWMRVAYVAFVLFFILGGSVVWRFCIILSWSLLGFYQFFGGWFNPLGVVSLGVAWYMTALVIWLFGRRRKSVYIPALDALLLALYGTVGLAIIQTIFVFSFSAPFILLGINLFVGVLAVWLFGTVLGALLTHYGYRFLFIRFYNLNTRTALVLGVVALGTTFLASWIASAIIFIGLIGSIFSRPI